MRYCYIVFTAMKNPVILLSMNSVIQKLLLCNYYVYRSCHRVPVRLLYVIFSGSKNYNCTFDSFTFQVGNSGRKASELQIFYGLIWHVSSLQTWPEIVSVLSYMNEVNRVG